jgi:cytidylate kinase
MIIAIDGPAASGKGTLAKRIADRWRLAYLDTGLLYRAVAREVRARGGTLDDPVAAEAAARALDPETLDLDDPGLRHPGLGESASIVARIPQVRAALLAFQRSFARRGRGAVLDGRDIGTVVCPDADVKLFITASAEVRAERRYKERLDRGESTTYEVVLDDIRRRDERDAGRQAAPMRRAPDAFLLDTTDLDIETAFDTAVGVISRKVGQRGCTS